MVLNLTGGDLTRAGLERAGATAEQPAQAKSLQGVTMPDGAVWPGTDGGVSRYSPPRQRPTNTEAGLPAREWPQQGK